MEETIGKRLSDFIWSTRSSNSQFARTIGVTPQAISHIISGRSNPSSDLLKSVFTHYPQLNATWLMTGTGSMLIGGESATEDQPTERKPVPVEVPNVNPILEELRLMRQELGRAMRIIESQQELLRKHSGSRKNTMPPLKKVA
ncbi:MAG: helix-turn-helix domain-containing protein [Bacteroidota bacterium]